VTAIGRLKHRVTFQEDSGTPDAGGSVTPSWGNLSTVPTVFARVEPLNVTTEFKAGQEIATTKYRVTIRERNDITTAMRLTTTVRGLSKTLYIKGLRTADELDERFTEILCESTEGC